MTEQGCLWRSPPEQVILGADEVHLWRVALDQPAAVLQGLGQTLAADEAARAARFYFDRDRRHFTAGRGMLRLLLAQYLDLAPDVIRFTYGPQNKPALAEAMRPAEAGRGPLQFNLSHSHGQALYAFTWGREIGVDLEQVRPMPDAESIAGRFFSARDYATFLTLPATQRDEGFFNCWTRKEAYIKALGEGLSHPLDRFDVSLRPGEPAQLLAVAEAPEEVERWSMRSLKPVFGYVAALVVEGRDWSLRCWGGEAG